VKAGGKQNNPPAGYSGLYRKQKLSGRVELPSFPRPANGTFQPTPVLVSYWFARIILYYGRANGNCAPLFYLPSVSYINPDFRLADCSAYHLLSHWFLPEHIFSSLKMEAICSSETSVDTQRTTRRYILQYSEHILSMVELNSFQLLTRIVLI
jgi:hypothetical protein